MAAAPARKTPGLEVRINKETDEYAILEASVFGKNVLLISGPDPEEIFSLLEDIMVLGKRKFEEKKKAYKAQKNLKKELAKEVDQWMNETPLQRLVANCPDTVVAPGLYTLGNPPRPIAMTKNEPSFRFGSGVPEPFKPADQEKTADSEQAAVTKSVDLTKE